MVEKVVKKLRQIAEQLKAACIYICILNKTDNLNPT